MRPVFSTTKIRLVSPGGGDDGDRLREGERSVSGLRRIRQRGGIGRAEGASPSKEQEEDEEAMG